MSNNIKLNLNYISDVIKDEYKQWKNGDQVIISSQTGTGKTFFIQDKLIPYARERGKNVLILYNRKALGKQIKKDLLKQANKEIPRNLNDITEIDNVYIWSYQKLNENLIYNDDFSIDYFSYIIADEFHYILNDSFTGKTQLSYNKLVKEFYPNSIQIYISATFDIELKKGIKKELDKRNEGCIGTAVKKLYEYSSGRDYTYLKPCIYSDEQLLLNEIIKDQSDNKWIIFKNNIEKAKELQKKLLENNIDTVFIYSNCKGKRAKQELNNIIRNEKFECKVLLSTSTLDNGVNFKDEKIKNIVFDAWNWKITLIQCVGRVRFNSFNEAYPISLYLNRKTKQQVHGKIHDLKQKIEQIELLKDNPDEFKKKYNRNLNNLPNYIYLDQNNNYKYDEISYYNLQQELNDMERMKNNYRDNIHPNKCLLSLGLRKNAKNIVEVIDLDEIQQNKNIDELEQYLNSILNKPLDKTQQQELILKLNIRDNRNRVLKSVGVIKEYLKDSYNMTIETDRARVKGKQITLWKLIKLGVQF